MTEVRRRRALGWLRGSVGSADRAGSATRSTRHGLVGTAPTTSVAPAASAATTGSTGPGVPGAEARRRSAPPRALIMLALCVGVVVLCGWSSFARFPETLGSWWKVLLLVVLAITFEEGSARLTRLRMHFGSELTQDLSSVWCFAAVMALPRAWTMIVIGVVLLFIWYRQDRPEGMAAYRGAFNVVNVMVTCLAAGAVLAEIDHALDGLPAGIGMFVAVVAAMALYAVLQRALVTAFLVARGAPTGDLVGSATENLIEMATLCLGALVALAIVHSPWLAVLVLVPMVALQREARIREFESAASTDTKTGLLNAVAWEYIAQREVVRATRLGNSLAVLVIDIDRFKLVNDRFGHLVGDRVLRGVGQTLAAGVRDYDNVGRFGGEEFVAVLPDASVSEALTIAERLRAAVNRVQLGDLTGGAPRLTDDPAVHELVAVSIGVACLPGDGIELPDLLMSADAALYRAKNEGRNRVVLGQPPAQSGEPAGIA